MKAGRRGIEPTTPVQYVPGVGPVRAQQLRRMGIELAGDLLHHYPADYLHPGTELPLDRVRVGQKVVTRGRVLDAQRRRTRRGRTLVVATVGEGNARLRLTWFNAPWVIDRLRVGRDLVISGEVTTYGRFVQIVNPQIEEQDAPGELGDVRPRPRYPLTAGLKQGTLRRIADAALDPLLEFVDEPLPDALRRRFSLCDRREAFRAIHRPEDLEEAGRARERLAFDEALALQLAVGVRRRRLLRREATWCLEEYGEASTRYVRSLGFELTRAQRRVLSRIARDLRQPVAMHRLLQGDVGSGKTLVAVVAMIWAAESGAQAAFMAPTEILARQHARRQIPALAEVGLSGALLTGSTPAEERRRILAGLADGSIQCVFGTHALIQEGVAFRRLGLAVVDEQHRFGVVQRASLAGSGSHLLVMTATPIPRSLALTVYGDLDLSVIDEIPPGRSPVLTRVEEEGALDEIYAEVVERARSGGRSYLVFPLIEESEGSDLASAEAAHENLREGALAGVRVGLLHGRLPAAEKQRVMEDFADGRLDVLVSTTVIEVGMDVPEATFMVIHQAERFGLAQLHQLRGRVGRGAGESACLLVAGQGASPQSHQRLHRVARTRDGFALAEFDLRERGMGDLQGIRQHGELPFRVLNPLRDESIVEATRELAREILEEDPHLERPEHRSLARWLEEMGRRSPLWSAAG